MPLTVRRGSGAVEYALVAELDALRRIVAQAAGLFHLEVSSVGGGDFTTPTLFPLVFAVGPRERSALAAGPRLGDRRAPPCAHPRRLRAPRGRHRRRPGEVHASPDPRRRHRARERREGEVQRAPVAGGRARRQRPQQDQRARRGRPADGLRFSRTPTALSTTRTSRPRLRERPSSCSTPEQTRVSPPSNVQKADSCTPASPRSSG